jgi:hypothetical protein
VILDFLNEKLLWREQKKEKVNPGEDGSYSMEEVRIIKTDCLQNPNEKLWRSATRDIEEVRTIFYHLQSLEYGDKPDYALIRNNLKNILQRSIPIPRIPNPNLTTGQAPFVLLPTHQMAGMA